MASGYSSTPLARKLSLRDGQRVWFSGMPETVGDEIDEYALDLTFVANPADGIDAAHIFVVDRVDMEAKLALLRNQVSADGQVWVSWPKQAAGVSTDITEEVVRDAGLPLGFVDTKVCAIDDTWCGLKLVVRKELR